MIVPLNFGMFAYFVPNGTVHGSALWEQTTLKFESQYNSVKCITHKKLSFEKCRPFGASVIVLRGIYAAAS